MIHRRDTANARSPREGGLPEPPQSHRRTRALTRTLGISAVTVLLAALAVSPAAQHDDRDGLRSSGAVNLPQTHAASGSRTSIHLVAYPTHGQVLSVAIPGGTSAFRARRASIYLPPVLAQAPQTKLPVLMLLHGVPGRPSSWLDMGALAQTMDAFAATHGGLAPIVVMPDINGSFRSDTECVNGRRGKVEDYLTRVVPDFVRAHLPAADPGRHWAIAGLSEGATCSLMLGLRHTSVFSTVVFFSGLARPTVGRTDNAAATIRQLFRGSRSAYNHHDPLWLMRHATYPSLAMWLEAGAQDRQGGAAAARVAAAARKAHISTVVRSTPGSHQWTVWQASLRQALPWVWARIGL